MTALVLIFIGCTNKYEYPHIYPDGAWGPNVIFLGRSGDAFKVIKAEWISGLSIHAVYTGKIDFPYRLYADMYDHDAKIVERKIRVWHRRVAPGETVYMNIRNFSSPNIILVEISGIWERNDRTTE